MLTNPTHSFMTPKSMSSEKNRQEAICCFAGDSEREIYSNIVFLFRLNPEIRIQFGNGSTIRIL